MYTLYVQSGKKHRSLGTINVGPKAIQYVLDALARSYLGDGKLVSDSGNPESIYKSKPTKDDRISYYRDQRVYFVKGAVNGGE